MRTAEISGMKAGHFRRYVRRSEGRGHGDGPIICATVFSPSLKVGYVVKRCVGIVFVNEGFQAYLSGQGEV